MHHHPPQIHSFPRQFQPGAPIFGIDKNAAPLEAAGSHSVPRRRLVSCVIVGPCAPSTTSCPSMSTVFLKGTSPFRISVHRSSSVIENSPSFPISADHD